MQIARNMSGDYIGIPKTAKILCDDYGINPELRDIEDSVCSIGFSEKDQKWYGWSHRAIYGFTIGSKLKKGDNGYVADNVDELYDDHIEFFSDVRDPKEVADELTKDYENNRLWVGEKEYSIPIVKTPEGLNVAIEHPDIIPDQPLVLGGYWIDAGKGEWEAKTMEDARQMACDFAEGVS